MEPTSKSSNDTSSSLEASSSAKQFSSDSRRLFPQTREASSWTVPDEKQLKLLKLLEHVIRCTNFTCCESSCSVMKRSFAHYQQCKAESGGICVFCKQLSSLSYLHAHTCQNIQCIVPFCESHKLKLKKREVSKFKANTVEAESIHSDSEIQSALNFSLGSSHNFFTSNEKSNSAFVSAEQSIFSVDNVVPSIQNKDTYGAISQEIDDIISSIFKD
ncbi:hypothetical protein NPIL_15571 [Nephila pilipes]|uniref:histone acetyltransferase n=1 Tax=Nephila pilipes TaxID=299642 RepID=A0A8X6U929_NEPPI|nr:hypothetical protein NPIL_15571 [Nephila pilipes]